MSIYSSTDEQIKKLWYIYTMEYYSAIKRNTFDSVPMRWMNLEPIIQSEVSQKEKDKYLILTHIYGIQKGGTDKPICRASGRHRDREQTCGHREGRRGWEKLREQHCSIYIATCKIRQLVDIYYMMQGAQIWCSVTIQRGRGFKEEGTYIYLQLINVDIWQKPTQYCKAIILQLKIIILLKRLIWKVRGQ